MTKLVISLATRGRPEQLITSVKKSIGNWSHPETMMQIQVDDDDTQTIEALKDPLLFEAHLPLDTQRVEVNVGPREDTIAAKWNRILKVPADVYMYHADDDPYIVKGYDQLTLDAAARFPDGIGAVFGHLANLSFSCTYAATSKYVKKLGFLLPDYFPYWFCDHWTDDLARMLGRISFAHITTDQSKAGVTQEMREPGWWATFYDAAYLFRRDQVMKIFNDPEFQSPLWQKELLLSCFPLIDVRSRMINQSVRNESARLSGWAGNLKHDERYMRVKDRAIAMVPKLLNKYGMPDREREMFAKALGVTL